MSQRPNKRRRTAVSVKDKQAICLEKRTNPRKTLQDLVTWSQSNLGIELGRSTLGDILKDSVKWLSMSEDSNGIKAFHKAQHPELEQALHLWFADASSQNATGISDGMLIEKARELGDELGVSDFSYSRGWLTRFKVRHGMKRQRYHGARAVSAVAGRTAIASRAEVNRREVNEPIGTLPIVSHVTSDDTDSDDTRDDDLSDDDETDAETRTVDRSDARLGLRIAIAFFEQKGNAKVLDNLWAALREVDTVKLKQSSITNYFKKE